MSERLLRALQGGGITSPIERDLWGVWRGRDRRRRMIGTLAGAEIDVLRLQARLVPMGDDLPPILVWSGTAARSAEISQGDARVLRAAPIYASGPALEHLIARCSDPAQRAGYRTLVERYRADHEAASTAGQMPGMNWQGLALGGRVQGGRVSTGPMGIQHAAEARARLARIRRDLSAEEAPMIDGLILREEGKATLAKRLQMRQALVERRAIAALRTLEKVYAAMSAVAV